MPGKGSLQHLKILHDDGVSIHLTKEAKDLGMAHFPEDH